LRIKVFGSVTNAMGGYYKTEDGTRVQVVGVAEDGKYYQLTEDPKPAMFLPFLQSPSTVTCLVVRSDRDPQQLAQEIRSRLRDLDPACPLNIQTWTQGLDVALFPSHVATVALGVLGMMGAMLSITGIFGMAAYSVSKRLRELGIRIALGAQRKEVLQAALGRPRNCWQLVRRRDCSSEFWPPRCCLTLCIRQIPAIRWCWAGLSGDVAVGTAGHVDSGATRAVGQSSDPAARGVSSLD
jgi:hypothetical protein